MTLPEMKKRFQEITSKEYAGPGVWIQRHDDYRELARSLIRLCEAYREAHFLHRGMPKDFLIEHGHEIISEIDLEAQRIFEKAGSK